MELVNETPFAASLHLFLDADGREQLLAVVKGTWSVVGPAVELAARQVAVAEADVYRGDPARTGLVEACDLVPAKPATDVLLGGKAYTVEGRRTEAMVGFRLEGLQKSLRVVGDRTWERGLASPWPGPAQPFASLELSWERAFGGTDDSDPELVESCPENPAGVGFRRRGSARPLVGTPLANVEDPAHPLRGAGDHPPPAGFGPVAPHWAPRQRWAGTHDAAWRRTRYPLQPRDFDPRFYQCAPPDQLHPGHLRGGEAMVVAGMTPNGKLAFRLPRLAPRAAAVLDGGAELPFPAGACDTLLVDCERREAVLVWRSVLPVHGKVERVDCVEVQEEARGR